MNAAGSRAPRLHDLVRRWSSAIAGHIGTACCQCPGRRSYAARTYAKARLGIPPLPIGQWERVDDPVNPCRHHRRSLAASMPNGSESGLVPSRTRAARAGPFGISDFCQAPRCESATAALIGLFGWMRKPGASVADLSGLPGLVEYLETNPEPACERFQIAFAELLSEMNCISLFAEAGIPSDHSFVSEIGAANLRPAAALSPRTIRCCQAAGRTVSQPSGT